MRIERKQNSELERTLHDDDTNVERLDELQKLKIWGELAISYLKVRGIDVQDNMSRGGWVEGMSNALEEKEIDYEVMMQGVGMLIY